VARHAAATRVRVSLHSESGRTKLEVCDNGKGIPETEIGKPDGFGLIGMRERAEHLGGRVSIEAKPGGGTRLTVCIPAAGTEVSE